MWPFDLAARRRIADLEARNGLLVHQVTEAREDANAWEWAAHRADDQVTAQDQQRREFRVSVQQALATERGRTARYRAAWQSARRRASIVQFCDRVPFLPECQHDAAAPCDHDGRCPVVICHIGNRADLDDLIRAATADTALVAAERDGAMEALRMESRRVEWLTDQLVTALGYPEAALGAPAPTVA